MKPHGLLIAGGILLISIAALASCATPTPEPTPTPTPPPPTATPTTAPVDESGAAAHAVDLIAEWVEAGAPEAEPFDYTGIDGNTHEGAFETDILPLFTTSNVWFEGAPACTACHFDNSETSYHELNLSSHAGILTGADSLEAPPGEPILGESSPGAGDFDWDHSKLRARLRNNRMPPGWTFDLTEVNRNGPCLIVSAEGVQVQTSAEGKIEYGCDLNAVGLIAAWVEAGVPETDAFSYGDAQLTFARDVQPFFTQPGMWFEGSQACATCHFAVSENSYHELDLSTYAGILAGADSLEEPPGESILGESAPGAGDYSWDASKLRERLRNNRMSPGFPFDITEANRNGQLVLHGQLVEQAEEEIALGSGECRVRAVQLIEAWAEAGAASDTPFDFTDEDGTPCSGAFEADILPLFTTSNVWFEGAPACTACHFDNSETSYHELNLSSHAGILTGADSLEAPPGEPILGESSPGAGDFDWDHSKLRARLRNNRMPPGWTFDLTEVNRNGPCLIVSAEGVQVQTSAEGKIEYGCDLNAVGLIAAWVEAGVPETDAFSYGDAQLTFARDVQPFFTQPGMWFEGSQACATCHFAVSENSYHELDLSTYAGILAGADSLEEPPGESILGESAPGAGDYSWDASKLRERLRNNRMSPGFPFDITEANRNGPIVLAGTKK
jgi:hypothetical protein